LTRRARRGVRLDLIHEDRAPLCLASNASTSTTNRRIKPTCLTLRQQVPTGLYGVDRTRKIRPLARFLDWSGRLCRWNLGIETHLAERTTNNVALGSQWICWRSDHSGEAGAALGTANRMVTIDGARECRQRAEYSRKTHQRLKELATYKKNLAPPIPAMDTMSAKRFWRVSFSRMVISVYRESSRLRICEMDGRGREGERRGLGSS